MLTIPRSRREPVHQRVAGLLPPKVSTRFFIGGLTLSTLYALGVFGEFGPTVFTAGVVATVVAVAVGIRRNKPAVRWTWGAFIAALSLFIFSSALRNFVPSTGVLTADRSPLPDFFAVPGYMFYAAGLLGLLHQRRGLFGTGGSVLDAVITSIAAMLLSWVAVITPVLGTDIPLAVLVEILIYVPISVFLVAVAAKLAFTPGQRSQAFRYLLGLVLAMLAGDVFYLFVEIGAISQGILVDVPYAVAATMLGAAALHPSMRILDRATATSTLRVGRLALVGLAMLVPAVMLLVHPPVSTTERLGAGIGSLVLVVLAVARVVQSMREQQRYERELSYKAAHDSLTGLPNRAQLLDRVGEMLTGSRRTAVLFLDLDQFKMVNDSMGHLAGDELLVAVAERLKPFVNAERIVARVSGDEFVIAAQVDDSSEAMALAREMRELFDEPFVVRCKELFLTASVGVALDDDGLCALELVRDADTAMYHSKIGGRDTVTMFNERMREQVSKRLELESRLRRALANDELSIAYQPIVSLPHGRIEGFEALMRWNSSGENIRPDVFIPIAEDCGLIVELGAWILEAACTQLASWRNVLPNGDHLYISVNLSARQVREDDVVSVVEKALERSGLPASALWLEITESVMLDDNEATMAKLDGLCALGVRLSVDDFGTGFSSLSYLKRLPVNRVKIDRGFVQNLETDSSDATLVHAIIAMAEALGLNTIAEGVETDGHRRALSRMGCRHAQGYLFSPPVPACDIPQVVSRHGVIPAGV